MGLISRFWKKSGGEQQLEAEPATSGDIMEALKPLILLPDNEASFLFCHLPLPLLINAPHSTFSLADGLVIRGWRRQEAAAHLPGKPSPQGQTLWVLQTRVQKVQAPVPAAPWLETAQSHTGDPGNVAQPLGASVSPL